MPTDYYAHKRHLILNLINHLGPISRTELVALTDYRPASIGEITKEMLDEGMIVKTGYSSTGYGRRRALLEINHSHICAIGICLLPTAVTYIVAQIDGTVLRRVDKELHPDEPDSELADQIVADVLLLLEAYSKKNIVGIGICDPLYDPARYQKEDSLRTSYAHFNDWWHLDLKPKMERVVSVPVRTFSAVTLPALAEQRFGVAKDRQNFICVELSNGIGASICCNGSVVGGATGVAGEIGHTTIDASDPHRTLCYCGKPGCVEADTAFPALSRNILAALDRGVFSTLNTYYDRSRSLTVDDIRRALDEDDQVCKFYVKQAALRLGAAVANAVNLLNPELVVLYGFMLRLGDYFISLLDSAIRENVLVLSKDFEIRTSTALESLLPLGAAAELFTTFLKIYDYQWVYKLTPEEFRSKAEETA